MVRFPTRHNVGFRYYQIEVYIPETMMAYEFTAAHIGKAAAWGLPMVFVAGGLYITLQALAHDVDEIATRHQTHADLEAHPVSQVKIEDLMVEQRAMREDLAEQAVNIAAICQATGASCR